MIAASHRRGLYPETKRVLKIRDKKEEAEKAEREEAEAEAEAETTTVSTDD